MLKSLSFFQTEPRTTEEPPYLTESKAEKVYQVN